MFSIFEISEKLSSILNLISVISSVLYVASTSGIRFKILGGSTSLIRQKDWFDLIFA